ncbi:hypothetical protein P22_2039 [Propionispora sp. 2/2-37]|uniref:S-layer homology domain-containing protein n=2 Tax=Propionispora sp. 2/2-37 TaxID=1677858 RepID=UPI0006BB5945|nr:S-layer homology domain-containing protein [Propionispora sp. 2/2-37]CUH95951.1 hypothetical protein P22_2039 [Propionispora sp. 2/2-37]
MKKKSLAVLALVIAMGFGGTALAAPVNPFDDVPASHWSYAAVEKLVHDGVVTGYDDNTFKGDKPLTRYEMAVIVGKAISKQEKADADNKALIEKLSHEYSRELDNMGVRIDNLESRVDNVKFFGYVRANYDSDTVEGETSPVNGNGNKHFYMDFEANMKVNDRWEAHFQSETNETYSTNRSWGENDGTFQRIWATGSIGAVDVTAGKKWWGYGSNLVWGHSGSGVQFDYAGPSYKVSVFNFRPTQLDGNGNSINLTNAANTTMYGLNLNADLSKAVNVNLLVGGNEATGDETLSNGTLQKDSGITKWGGIDVSAKIMDNVKITGSYAKTNADDYDYSQQFRLDYKGMDLKSPGSFGAYLRVLKLQKYGDPSHDDEWSSLPSDMKGWILGVDYAIGKDIQWTTLYGHQKLNISGTDTSMDKDSTRKLIRTRLDFHF